MSIFKDLYQYRELLKTNVQKEVRGKYKNSFLGILWSFLNPLLQLVVYSVIFGSLLGGDIPGYIIYNLYIFQIREYLQKCFFSIF